MNRIAPRLRLGEQLLARGLIDRDQLEIALAEQAHTGQPLGALLVQLGFVADTLIRDVLAERLGIAAVALEHYIADPAALAALPEAQARHWRVFPLHYQPASRCLQLAMTRPTDLPLCDQIMQHSHGQIARLDPHLACEADILQAIDRHYGHPVSLDAILQEIRQGPVAAPLHPGLADSQPVIRLIDAMLTDAVLKSASDIHFEPEARFVRIRYRIDGVLRQVRSLHKDYWPAMLVRLKVISGLNIAEQRAPQDGRVSLTLSGRAVDFRVSSLPTSHGENLVMRLLDRSRGLLPLARLVPASQLAAVQRLLARPEGMVLVTGPTGAGKTTTLYAMLNQLNDSAVNIMTLEDPVEYPMPWVRQTSINETVKLDFADGIRSLMRQDPDVILVGEIRDHDTAAMAFRAAMTGHRVLSTLHTHSALAAIPRLLDLGVLPDVMAGNIVGVIGQRLVRRLCPHCRQPLAPDAAARRLLGLGHTNHSGVIYQPGGCAQCDGVGYRGRQAIMEVQRIDAELDALIGQRASLAELRRCASHKGFQPLAEAAIGLVLSGQTALEEVLRVVDLTDRM